jgi:hypothetical protein
MLQSNRRSALKVLAGAALTAGSLPLLARQAAAQQELYVAKKYQNFKRGTINSVNRESNSFTIVWEDLGRFKLKASDLIKPTYGSLKPGQVCDVQWYDYVDFLIAPTTDASMAQARAMVAKGARIEGMTSVQPAIKLWSMDGMVTKVDSANNQIYLLYKSGGDPEQGQPSNGEVIQLPVIVTDAGKAGMASLKQGDQAVAVYSQQTAVNVTIIR